MTRAVYIAIAVLFAFVGGVIAYQARAITRLEEYAAEKDRAIGEMTAANAGLTAALFDARETARAADGILADHAGKTETANIRARKLEYQLREALAHEKAFDLDSPLPPDAADALCLRWHAASGYGAGDHTGYSAGISDAGESHTASCAAWRRLTWRDLAEWIGSLLDHAGAERMDKAALRAWTAAIGE